MSIIDPNFTVEQGRKLDEAVRDLAAARARIKELGAALAPRERSMTHSADCWRWHRHHGCAIRRVEELEAALKLIRTAAEKPEPPGGSVDEALAWIIWRARAALGERDG